MDEFLVLLQAKLDEAKSKGNVNADIKELQNQLDKLKVQVELDPKAGQKLADDIGKLINQKITISNIAVNQSNLSKTGQQIGQIISDSAEKAIGDVTSKVIGKGFTVSPAMSKKVQSELESIVKDWTNNKGKVNSITIDTKTDFNEKTLENIEQLRSATVQYSNELGQVITKTLKYKQIGANTFANGETEVIKGWVESASTYKATLESTSKSTNTFVAQQKKTVTDLTNQVNQIYKSAIDQNASKPIKDSTNLSNLENKYNDIVTAIGKMGNASEATFTDERNSVNTLISDLKIVVKEYKNAETAATSMRSKDVGTIKSIKTNELNEFIAKIKNSKVPMKEMQSEIAKLKTSLSGIHDTDSLTAYLNQFDIANSKFKSLKEQFAKNGSLSSVIFNPVDLEKQGKVYIQRVRNTIEAIKPELESKLRSAGYSDIEIKGVEDAKGKIKSLTATVTDATGAFKQLNFERAKIQGSNKINHGFIQTDDVKVIGNISSEIDKTQNSLSTLKVKWEEQGVLVGEFKAKIDQLESSLSSVGSKDELNGLKSQIQELKNEASTISQIHEIQLSITDKSAPKDNYNLQIEKQIAQLKSLGLTDDEVTAKTKVLTEAHAELKQVIESTNYNSVNEKNQAILSADEKRTTALNQVKNAYEQAKIAYDKYMQPVSNEKATSLINRINTFLSKNTRITKDARIELQGYVDELGRGVNLRKWNEINAELKKIENFMRGLHRLGASLKDQMSQAAQSFTQWLSVSSAVMLVLNQFRKMPMEVYAIDTAMTELAKVSDTTMERLSQSLENSAQTAKKYASTIDDVVSATADWSRLGYSIDDAEKLAEIATIYKNVGDGIDIATANESLVSTLQGFKMNAEEALHIIDAFNEVANTEAINSAGIGEALKRSASSMYAAGNTLEETIGLVTAANAVVQDPESIGNAYKTISMRIRGAKTEMQELGLETDGMVESTATLQKEILALSGVDIMKDKNTFKSTYQILDELSTKWKDLTDIQQASITELIAGKRQGNIISALMNNFDTARRATETALNSGGSALKEQETYLSSLEAKTKQFEAAFQSLSNTVVDSDLLKSIVDFGTKSVSSLEGVVKVLETINSFGGHTNGLLGTIGALSGLLMNKNGIGKSLMLRGEQCTAPTPLRLCNNAT